MSFSFGWKTRSESLDSLFVSNFGITEKEGKEYDRKAQEQLSGNIGVRVEPACAINADEESKGAFVDVVGDERGDEGAESEDSILPTL